MAEPRAGHPTPACTGREKPPSRTGSPLGLCLLEGGGMDRRGARPPGVAWTAGEPGPPGALCGAGEPGPPGSVDNRGAGPPRRRGPYKSWGP